MSTEQIDALESLLEARLSGGDVPPPAAFAAAALRDRDDSARTAGCRRSTRLLGRAGAGAAHLVEPVGDGARRSRAPHYDWFKGGGINASVNCLDRHVEAGRGDRVAYLWTGEQGEEQAVTYAQLLDTTERLASVLRSRGVGEGDVVGIYLPMTPDVAAPCWPVRASAPSTTWSSAGSRRSRWPSGWR